MASFTAKTATQLRAKSGTKAEIIAGEFALVDAAIDSILAHSPAMNNTDKKSYVVAGVISYNSTTQTWEQIDGAHSPLNISTISCANDELINITFNLDSIQNKKVVTFTVTPDETLAGIGVFAGASVGTNSASINLYTNSYGASIAYDGSAWTQMHGTAFPDVLLAWDTDKLTITVPYSMLADSYQWPSISTKDSPYRACLGSVGGTTINVTFYNAAGTKVTTPDTDMKFFIQFGMRKMKTYGTAAIPNGYGNLWYFGIIEGDP